MTNSPAPRPTLVLCELRDSGVPRVESYSPFCLKAHRALQLCGLPYERRHGSRPSDFGHLNPAEQVPVLLVGDEAVADSTRIVSRLEALSGGALSRGLDARASAEAFLWEEFADSALYGFVVASRWADDDNWTRTKRAYFASMPALVRAVLPGRLRARVVEGLRARDVIRPNLDRCWENFEHVLDRLEVRAPDRGYWLGDAPSRADVAIFAQLFSFRTPLTPRQAERVALRSRLSTWLDRVDDACLHAAIRTPARDAETDGVIPAMLFATIG